MACLSGSTTGSSTAIGISSNLSVGMASIDSKSHTNLVATLSPGEKPGYGCFNISLAMICAGLMVLGLSTLIAGGMAGAAVTTLGPGIVILFVLFRAKEKLKEQGSAWNEKSRMYKSGWICHKCGHTWIPGEVPHVENNYNPKPKASGQYKKSLVGVSIVIALFALMALVTPKPTPSKASNPTPSKTIPPTPPKPELVNNNLDPMAMNVKMKHPDWSDEICTAVGKGELVKGMNSAQASATIESKKFLEKPVSTTTGTPAADIVAECKKACSQLSGFSVGSADYNACVYACTH